MGQGPFPTLLWRLRQFHGTGGQCSTTVGLCVREQFWACLINACWDIHLYTLEMKHPRADQHDPNDRLRDICKFSFKRISSLLLQWMGSRRAQNQSYLMHTISCASKVTAWQSISQDLLSKVHTALLWIQWHSSQSTAMQVTTASKPGTIRLVWLWFFSNFQQCNAHRTSSVTLVWQNIQVLRLKPNLLLFMLQHQG